MQAFRQAWRRCIPIAPQIFQRRCARVLVVHTKFPHVGEEEALWDEEEAKLLCSSLHAVEVFPTIRVDILDPRWTLRQSDLKRILVTLVEKSCDQLFINTILNPTQQHHLELAVSLISKFTRVRVPPVVIDRRRLVLDIFIQKSPSKSARLQAQLVDLQLQKTPLVTQNKALGPLQGLADALSRSIGARMNVRASGHQAAARNVQVSFQSDPQITKMKAKRVVDEKERKLKMEIDTLAKARQVHRHGRQGAPTIGIVGYTNVGKSALANALTHAELDVRDQLFATTSTAFRQLGSNSIVMDTVGFIKDLPCELFEAFRATIDELKHSQLILHVRDVASPGSELMLRTVKEALKDVDVPVVEVWNKADLMSEAEIKHYLVERAKRGDSLPMVTSCVSGEGIEELRLRIKEAVSEQTSVVPGKRTRIAMDADSLDVEFSLPLAPVAWAFLHKQASVLETHDDRVEVQFPNTKTKAQFSKLFGL